ncbi:MAG: patatin-like phospholipase family protein [Bacteroidales bacterium]|nr:patatin-like phospholipase family protein [Bacteroidales bacterium]
MSNEITKKYAVGFALSGGFIRGFAHMGAIQALSEYHIHPDIVAGVSAGSIAAAFLADGFEPFDVMEMFKKLNFIEYAKPNFPKYGILKINDLMTFIKKNLRSRNFEELQIPMIAVATDIERGRSVFFDKGSIAERVVSSCCVPSLFSPINIDGVDYVDGGVFMNLPVTPIRKECEKVVAINVSPIDVDEYKPSLINISLRAFHFMIAANTIKDSEMADILIEPKNLYSFSNISMSQGEEIFQCGYDAAMEVLEKQKIQK